MSTDGGMDKDVGHIYKAMFITALFSIARIGTQPKCPLTDECTWGSLESESHSVVSDSLQPHELYSPWNSPGQNTVVGGLSLLQEIFPTQGLNPGLPHCRQILYQLSHNGSPRTLEWAVYPFSSTST